MSRSTSSRADLTLTLLLVEHRVRWRLGLVWTHSYIWTWRGAILPSNRGSCWLPRACRVVNRLGSVQSLWRHGDGRVLSLSRNQHVTATWHPDSSHVWVISTNLCTGTGSHRLIGKTRRLIRSTHCFNRSRHGVSMLGSDWRHWRRLWDTHLVFHLLVVIELAHLLLVHALVRSTGFLLIVVLLLVYRVPATISFSLRPQHRSRNPLSLTLQFFLRNLIMTCINVPHAIVEISNIKR